MTRAVRRTVEPAALRYGELDRDRVIDAALVLAGKQSLETITMRALAMHLGISPAAMYYHLRDRDELVDAATERVLARIKIPSVDQPWDTQLRALFSDARRAMLPVNGIATTLQSRPVAPSGQRLHHVATAILRAAGFSPSASRAANIALSTFLLGAVALEQAIALEGAAAPARRSAVSLFRSRDFTAGLAIIIAGLKYQKEMA